jgi:large subunit ribosomal protein L11
MATKKIKAQVKMLIQAGSATPAPPIGSTLGPHGINLVQFCAEINKNPSVGPVPVVVTIFDDRSYEFVIKTAPVSGLIKQKASIKKGAGNPLKDTVATLTLEDIKDIAQTKMTDLNAFSLEAAIKMVEGTCRSMGVKIKS